MFNKKSCKRCGEKIKGEFDFCPYCGSRLENEEAGGDWGMLGKNDFPDSFQSSFNEIKLPVGLNIIFNSLMKNLEKEFREMDKGVGREINPNKNAKNSGIKRSGISISISALGDRPPEIKINQFGNPSEDFKEVERQIMQKPIHKNFNEEKIKKFSKLPREEPLTNVRRLSNKVVYEIDLPGVKSIEDVSIIKLENSIEIKAVTKDKAYFKLLQIKLPIIDYKVLKDKLILELGAKN